MLSDVSSSQTRHTLSTYIRTTGFEYAPLKLDVCVAVEWNIGTDRVNKISESPLQIT